MFSTLAVDGATSLPTISAPAVIAPLCFVQCLYLALPALARARGYDADRPQHLSKITRTL